jgi:ATP-binding cassette, subfamily B, multidrug efflux pump
MLAVIFILLIPVILLIMIVFVKRIMPISKRVQEKLGELNTVLQENISGLRIVKAFAREDFEFSRFETQNKELLTENLHMVRTLVSFFPSIFFIANLGLVGVVWFGGVQVIGNRLSLGELVAFIGYLGFFLMPLFMLGFIGALYSRAEASAQRIFEVIDAESEVHDKPGAIQLNTINGQVIFDSVSFRYIGSEEYILENVSFEVKPGQVVAILGKTGSGKSTIINLIPRFYNATKGRLLIDGYDVRDIQLESLRSQIGIVLQESTLLSGTIRENIAYGKPSATIAEVIEAAKTAQAHEFITKLPDGYDTLVGEKGIGLSGGQKQRISIARGVLINPKILILDDSTSAVDARTEFSIKKALKELMRGRTSFIIAQRINTVKDADLILVLEDRHLVAKGTHEQLLETSEEYAEILSTQFGVRGEAFIFNQEEVTY